ncbi:MAG: DotA/TraY family protein, partial [Alphaproteobacteria bacterium]|nr:DotA/TraY family protein [Alphaproteobacteria bacterium]
LKYSLLPGILPRIIGIFSSGFSLVANLIAVIYSNFGLIPQNHPYLRPENYGKYSIRNVMAVASSNLVISRQNIDQVVIYFTILAGFILLIVQFILFGLSLVSHPALASTLWWQVFELQNYGTPPYQDLALVTLDRVFGVMSFNGAGSFFESCYANVPCRDINGKEVLYDSAPVFPGPFHIALHRLLEIYSMGIAFISMIIIIYYVIAIIGETITSGTPFGKRLNRAWFIPRLILFFAFIIPMNLTQDGAAGTSNTGINAAQFITFSVARWGSNMASNAWYKFHDTLTAGLDTYLGDKESLIAEPMIPEAGSFSQFMHIVLTCIIAEKLMHDKTILPYVVREHNSVAPMDSMGGTLVDFIPYFANIKDFQKAVAFSRNSNVYIRFGHYNPVGGDVASYLTNPPSDHGEYWGFVEPTCGELAISVTSTEPEVTDNLMGIQANHYMAVAEYLYDPMLSEISLCAVAAALPYDTNANCVDQTLATPLQDGSTLPSQWISCPANEDTSRYFDRLNQKYIGGDFISPLNGTMQQFANNTIDWIRTNYDYSVPNDIRDKGWVGAALWYNKIAEANGLVTSAIMAFPRPFLYPMVMEKTADAHDQSDDNSTTKGRYNPLLKNGNFVEYDQPADAQIANILYGIHTSWEECNAAASTYTGITGNPILDAVNMIFGTNGIIDIRENMFSIGADPRGNINIHPLAVLSSLGKGLVDASLRNLFFGVTGQGAGVVLDKVIGMDLGIETISTFLTKISFIGFALGFILYYVLPFMPFIYFFFAFGHWIKSVFEAIVAMPLWCMAHLKIDGEGLPGPWATNGYFLLMEIMLRPTLIVFGFIASIILFSSLVDVLHDLFDILMFTIGGGTIDSSISVSSVVHNVSLLKGPLDELMYTVVYVMLVYAIGVSCFKMIDSVPNNIIRWMGATVATFQENAGDPVQDLSGTMFRGEQRYGAQFEGMIDRLQGRMADEGKSTLDKTIMSQL